MEEIKLFISLIKKILLTSRGKKAIGNFTGKLTFNFYRGKLSGKIEKTENIDADG